MDGTRLNKYISEAGVASRRAADRMVEEGRVSINGRTAVLGDKVAEGDEVRVDGKVISPKKKDVVIAFNKLRTTRTTSSISSDIPRRSTRSDASTRIPRGCSS